MEYGVLEGEICGRDGCNGIIKELPKDGCCSCHISPPCSYCETQTEFCPACGWSAQEDQIEYDNMMHEFYLKNPPKQIKYKTDKQLYDELEDGKFGYVRVASGGHTICRLKGKHPNMSRSDIYSKIGIQENPNMPRMVNFSCKEFELTYFCD